MKLQTASVQGTTQELQIEDMKDLVLQNQPCDFRYDEGLRIRKDEISPTICTRSGEAGFSGCAMVLKKNE